MERVLFGVKQRRISDFPQTEPPTGNLSPSFEHLYSKETLVALMVLHNTSGNLLTVVMGDLKQRMSCQSVPKQSPDFLPGTGWAEHDQWT